MWQHCRRNTASDQNNLPWQAAMNLYKSAGPTVALHTEPHSFALCWSPVQGFLPCLQEKKHSSCQLHTSWIQYWSNFHILIWCDSCDGCAKKKDASWCAGCAKAHGQPTGAGQHWCDFIRVVHPWCFSLLYPVSSVCAWKAGIWANFYQVHHGCRRWYEVGVPQAMHGDTTSINHTNMKMYEVLPRACTTFALACGRQAV